MENSFLKNLLPKSKTRFILFPYTNGLFLMILVKSYSQNIIWRRSQNSGWKRLNLDVTLNPDFSNVEVDNIITNLTRFEISLPEKRQFFIDNRRSVWQLWE